MHRPGSGYVLDIQDNIHILAKQRLIGIGGDQFAFSRFCAMVPAKCFLAVTVFLLQFWASILVFKSFLPFGSFFTLKINLSDAPEQSG